MSKGFNFKLCSNGLTYLYYDDELYITDDGDYVILEYVNDISNFLNKLSDKINVLEGKVEDWEFSFRTEMAYHRVIECELKEKYINLLECFRDEVSLLLFNKKFKDLTDEEIDLVNDRIDF